MTDPQFTRQLALEADMMSMGRERYLKRLQDAKAKHQESTTDYGVNLLRGLVVPLADRITAYVAAPAGKGATHISRTYLKQLDPTVCSFITCRVVLDCLSRTDMSLQNVAIVIATALEDEGRMAALHDQAEPMYRVLKRDLKRSRNRRGRRSIFQYYADKSGVEFLAWPTNEKAHLGLKLLDFLKETSGIFTIELDKCTIRKRRRMRMVPTAELDQWIKGRVAGGELLCPVWLPMVVKPQPWITPYSWPYLTPQVRRRGLVKGARRGYLEELAQADLRVVYRSINALQETAWKINKGLLEVFEQAWHTGIQIADIPLTDPRDFPERIPLDNWKALPIEERRIRKAYWRTIKDANRKDKHHRLRFSRILALARQFKDDPRIYFPHQLDFRGRAYAIPTNLQPQGEDLAKALLTFADGFPINDDEAVRWLAIHGANSWGYDKVSLAARVRWTAENTKAILECAADPFANRWWADADKPWQFLAWCMEWAGFAKVGMGYVSHLPISVDGSCNGIRIFSAMLRDEIGGAAVNLIPYDEPQDIYQKVADGVLRKLKELPHEPYAAPWLSFGIDRKITKRAVMTLPYGSTRFAARGFIEEAIKVGIEDGKANPFDNIPKAAQFLVGLVWDVIGEVVTGARVAMKYLQELARLVSQEGLPVHWTSPSGFVCFQRYNRSTIKKVRTDFAGVSLELNIREETAKVDSHRHTNGISPNFVHSLDAAVLAFTVDSSLDVGIGAFAMVHDSFGTHAANVGALSVCLRHAFVGTFASDVLADFAKQVLSGCPNLTAPPQPTMGALDLEGVLNADYFFA